MILIDHFRLLVVWHLTHRKAQTMEAMDARDLLERRLPQLFSEPPTPSPSRKKKTSNVKAPKLIKLHTEMLRRLLPRLRLSRQALYVHYSLIRFI